MIIATKLVKNRTVLPHPILQLPNAIPIPITPRGGTNDAAIATPARPADIFLYHRAKNATSPDAKAIPRSTSVGWVLEAISLVTCVSGMSRVSTNHNATHPPILRSNKRSDLPNNFWFHVTIANATPCIGLIIGAISIAQITTGVASMRSQSVATTIDKNIWLRYSSDVSTSSIMDWAIFALTSPSRSRIAIFSMICGVFSICMRFENIRFFDFYNIVCGILLYWVQLRISGDSFDNFVTRFFISFCCIQNDDLLEILLAYISNIHILFKICTFIN